MRFNYFCKVSIVGFLILIVISCSSTKFVKDDQYLLDKVSIKADNKDINKEDALAYVAQKPNYETFQVFKFPLFLYNLSPKDTVGFISRTLRHAGEKPIIFDSLALSKTEHSLSQMAFNKGFFDTKVDAKVDYKKKKVEVAYIMETFDPYIIDSFSLVLPDTLFEKPDSLAIYGARRPDKLLEIGDLDKEILQRTLIKKGGRYDSEVLNSERERIVNAMRTFGYYSFNSEYVAFEIDTIKDKNIVNIETVIYPLNLKNDDGTFTQLKFKQFVVKEVNIDLQYDAYNITSDTEKDEQTLKYRGYNLIYGDKGKYLRPSTVLSKCFISPNELYNQNLTQQTYNSLTELNILSNINISYIVDNDSLICNITAAPQKKQEISTNVEATNTGGFFGLGLGSSYLHRNIFKHSESFRFGLKGEYTMVTPSFNNFGDNYFELGAETAIAIPQFKLPFVSKDFKRSVNATTEFAAAYSFQRRPDYYTRIVSSFTFGYKWNSRVSSQVSHKLNLIDVNYIHLPDLDLDFQYGLSIAALKYSFSDQFIIGASYQFSKTNREVVNKWRKPVYSFISSIESAGNALYLLGKIANLKKNSEGEIEIFGTKFAQYLRGTVDYSRTILIDGNNTVAWHLGLGLVYPYGNFKEVPIQKRFFAGGANSVRGWSVSDLGPGSYRPSGTDFDNFFYHSGEMKFLFNLEYRSKLFWILELAAFLDFGNIWTIKNDPIRPGGQFKVDSFYKEIAAAWGLGLRFDFNYFLLRVDCGFKGYNPQKSNGEKNAHWPIIYPYKIKDNAALHIAVGYPF